MREPNRHYRHSGSVGMIGIILLTLSGLLVAVVGGAAYGFALFFAPNFYFKFLSVIGFGLVIGYVVGLGAKAVKARNTWIPTSIGIAASCVGYYVGWVGYIYAASGEEVLAWLPENLLGMITELAQKGVWSVSGWTPKGPALYASWALELVLICASSTLFSIRKIASTPFCERCRRWCARIESSPKLSVPSDIPAFLTRVEQGDFNVLTELEPVHLLAPICVVFEFSACPKCEKERYLSGKVVQVETDAEGEERRIETSLLENLVLTEEAQDAIALAWFPKLAG